MEDTLRLSAGCDCTLVGDTEPTERLVEWTVQAGFVETHGERPPLSLALVIDRSGSMGSASKLGYAVQMAVHVLGELGERDRVAVVCFDDEVRTLCASGHVTAEYRARAQQAVMALRPGGSTDLHGGWLRGAGEVAENLLQNGVNRVLLLTDGLANVGLTDPRSILEQVAGLCKRGVSTSTFGVGLDYNEHLLRPMAEMGGGSYSFIESPAQIPDEFRREMGELLSVAARDVRLDVQWPEGVALHLFGDLPHEDEKRKMTIPLGTLSSGATRMLYTRVLTPPGRAGGLKAVRGRLWWLAEDGRQQSVAADVEFRYVSASEATSAPADEGVRERAARIDMEVAATQALRLNRDGDRHGARSVMLHAMARQAPHLAAGARVEYDVLADEMAADIDEGARKARDAQAWRRRHNRE